MSERVRCRSCEKWRDVEAHEFNRLNRQGRLTKRSLTGEWRGGSYVHAEYDLEACDACLDADPTKGRNPAIAFRLDMDRIHAHRELMESRGVCRDDAIREAVSRQMIRADVKLSPTFVAKLTGNEHLLEAHEPSDVAVADAWEAPVVKSSPELGCKVDGCHEDGPYLSCEMCALPTCTRHLSRHFTPMAGFGLDVCPSCMALL